MSNHAVKSIRVALVGIGNCAGSLVEGMAFYKDTEEVLGLLFPLLGGYHPSHIDFVVGFDISERKVGLPLTEAIYSQPNNFVRNNSILISSATVLRGPTLDGNPSHLAKYVPESLDNPVDVERAIKDAQVDVVVSLLPTGSHMASDFYASAALNSGAAFINCTPSIVAQDSVMSRRFEKRHLPLLGDDVKSQVGTTVLHRSLLHMLKFRGAKLNRTSQVNIGGNTDFANFVYRAESKLVSKRKSLSQFVDDAQVHVGHHYDPTQKALKTAHIEINAQVFGGSSVDIVVTLKSDDKPNCAGTVCDLIRCAKVALDKGYGGVIQEVAAFYMKSPPQSMEELEALKLIEQNWVNAGSSTTL